MDETEDFRRERCKVNNVAVRRLTREDLAAAVGQVWDTAELQRDFDVLASSHLRARQAQVGWRVGLVEFGHAPRRYIQLCIDRGRMRGVKGSAMAVEESRRRRRVSEWPRRARPWGRLVSIYNGMRSRAGNRDGRHPAYASVKATLVARRISYGQSWRSLDGCLTIRASDRPSTESNSRLRAREPSDSIYT